jgi:hypothetical protein
MDDLARLRYKNLVYKVFNYYLFKNVLNYAAIACPNKYTFEELKHNVLDIGNNALRYLQDQCDNFDFEMLDPQIEELFVLEDITKEKGE